MPRSTQASPTLDLFPPRTSTWIKPSTRVKRWLAWAVPACSLALSSCGGGGGGAGDTPAGGNAALSSPESAPSPFVVLTGNGAPLDNLGQDGSFYLDQQPRPAVLYGPRTDGKWPSEGTPLAGAPGADGQDGKDGRDGQDGKDGMDGKDGKDGSRLLSGAGMPPDGLGQDGDYYFDTVGAGLYGPRRDGKWPETGTTLRGPQGLAGTNGADGKPGSQIIPGRGQPLDEQGIDGDFFFDLQKAVVYGPKSNGSWPLDSALLLTGPKGDQGQPGRNGSRIYMYPGRAPRSFGFEGDYYINTLEVALYGPKTATEWPWDGIPLKGPTGQQGPQGPQGDPGPKGDPGPEGKGGGRTVNFSWILNNFGQTYGYGTYIVSLFAGLVEIRKDSLILPIACRKATFRAGTVGKLAIGSTYTFTVMHRPGPDFYANGTQPLHATAVGCALSETASLSQNACTSVVDNLLWSAGDAIQLQMVGNKAMNQMAVVDQMFFSLYCEE